MGRRRLLTVGTVLALVGERSLSCDRLVCELGVDGETVQAIVEQLVSAHLLERVEADGQAAVRLTPLGWARAVPADQEHAPPTPMFTETFCAQLRIGQPFTRACAAAGLTPLRVRRWLHEGEQALARGEQDGCVQFAEQVVRARVAASVALAEALRQALASDWRAAARLLRAYDAGAPLEQEEEAVATAPPRRALAEKQSGS